VPDRLFQRLADRFPTERIASSRLLRGVWRVALAVLRPRSVVMRLEDYLMRIPAGGRGYARGILHRGAIERAASAWFRDAVREGTTVVDVGANVGHYTLLAARRARRVVAFEPDPRAAEFLRENVALNGYGNVTVVEKALSAEDGTADFFVDDRNPGGHSLVEANTARLREMRSVETVRLDSFLPDGAVDLVKIDAQGAEAWIVSGARGVLERSRARLLLELWPFGLAQCGETAARLVAFLAELGYRPVRAFDRRSTSTTAVPELVDRVVRRSADPDAALDVVFAKDPS